MKARLGMLKAIQANLLHRLEALSPTSFPHVLSIPAPDLDVLLLGSHSSSITSCYWKDRDTSDSVIGFAIADQTDSLEELHLRLKVAPEEVRYYGGVSFPSFNPQEDSAWQGLPKTRFIRPLLEYRKQDTTAIFYAWIVSLADLNNLKTCVKSLRYSNHNTSAGVARLTLDHVTPSQHEWGQRAMMLVQEMNTTKTMQKIVLAAEACMSSHCFDPFLWLQSFSSTAPHQGHCFEFLFPLSNQAVFFGASPELLYRRKGNRLITEAVAGTRPRGQNAADDKAIESEFLENIKDKEEHDWVVRMIHDSLKNLTGQPPATFPRRVMKLPHLQHLYQLFDGCLTPAVQDVDICQALFPTPAVAGYPVAVALASLASTESFQRGWYAGIMGCVSREETVFSVAIRSALFSKNKVYAYAGAGLVGGSDWHNEWDEVILKLTPFLGKGYTI